MADTELRSERMVRGKGVGNKFLKRAETQNDSGVKKIGKRKVSKLTVSQTNSDFVSSRFQHLLDVHKSALKQIDDLKLENIRLVSERESESHVEDLRAENAKLRGEKDEADIRLTLNERRAQDALRIERERVANLANNRDYMADSIEERTRELDRTTDLLKETRQKSDTLTDNVKEFKEKIIQLEKKLEDSHREIERHETDPEERTLSDLGEIYAQIFALKSEDINQYDVINEKKRFRGVSLWFELLVKESLLNLDKRSGGMLGSNLDWFVNFMFKHDIAIYFCRYLGAFEEHQQIQGKNATRFDRKARADNLHQQRVTLLSVLYGTALSSDSY